MSDGIQGIKLCLFDSDGNLDPTQYLMIKTFLEVSTTLKKLQIDIHMASDHSIVASYRIGAQAAAEAAGVL